MDEKSVRFVAKKEKKNRQQRQSSAHCVAVCVCDCVCVFNLLACLLLYSLFIFKSLLVFQRCLHEKLTMLRSTRMCVCASVCVRCFTLERAGKSQKQNGNENENENENENVPSNENENEMKNARPKAMRLLGEEAVCVCFGGVANNKRDKIISPNLSHSRQQDQVKLYVCNGSSLFISLPATAAATAAAAAALRNMKANNITHTQRCSLKSLSSTTA